MDRLLTSAQVRALVALDDGEPHRVRNGASSDGWVNEKAANALHDLGLVTFGMTHGEFTVRLTEQGAETVGRIESVKR